MAAKQGDGSEALVEQEAAPDTQPAEYSDDEHLSAIDKQYAATSSAVPRRIHILGTGSIGKLVAHALRGIAKPPPITLIFHRYQLLKAWQEGKQEITIHDDGHDIPRSGFDVELMQEVRKQHGSQQGQQPQQEPPADASPLPSQSFVSDEPIYNLIVTTKAAITVPALSAVKHRIGPTSTICFLQNGMGIIDEVNAKLFPDEDSRPNYIQGILTHGANVPPEKKDPFYAVHAGHGSIALGLLPRAKSTANKSEAADDAPKDEKDIRPKQWAATSRYLLRTLTRCPVLCAVGFTPTELLQQQLEKLVANSVVNPLTALLDNRNGALLYNFALTRTMRLLLAETSHVITHLPELRGLPGLEQRFSTERLETLVVGVANKTKDNISSMLADVRAGRKTEIEYINGYIVKRGEELGVKCLVNYAIMQTVIGKAQMLQRETRGEVATEEEKGRALRGD
ncbi:ketopantoate reductase PanE/ApbA C terminal-domain-containing protein [Neohortaea acidophila]|uniref:2-dehydropantoate 2-reductase n=1 Tax=Neohortaea acidophila TaxID=245834 RepID=A0A6A6PR32_9PEZI|nr:ketopantoate reductase PanE/ApbA C terminal-domain-containing protein [Neohortaea acidophila]KAF2482161.1 ketopantoate reductase PanE/ApbA C terminal-domain-containing protein [Neohortaea acidophila]